MYLLAYAHIFNKVGIILNILTVGQFLIQPIKYSFIQ